LIFTKSTNFYPACRGEDEAADVSAASIRKVSVNYRPGNRILSAMKDAGFKKVTG